MAKVAEDRRNHPGRGDDERSANLLIYFDKFEEMEGPISGRSVGIKPVLRRMGL